MKALRIPLILAFVLNCLGPQAASAEEVYLPAPGSMVPLSREYHPPVLKGIKVYPDSPFRLDFILDQGDGGKNAAQMKQDSSRLIKYFLASLTVPEQEIWVNLSPYEKDRIIPPSFGLTEMGRDLLAEDYMLKQITASMVYPEDEFGKKFWTRVYDEAARRFHTTNVRVNTFNKVWIVPDKAVVYENAKAGAAYVLDARLKVLLEEDYLSFQKHAPDQTSRLSATARDVASIGANIVREIVIPQLNREVNENRNFARLRQVYHSLILAAWYKKKIRDSILSYAYAGKNMVAGVAANDPKAKDKIYRLYLTAFRKGVYNYIREETDPATLRVVPRKYFSGGMMMDARSLDKAMSFTRRAPDFFNTGNSWIVRADVDRVNGPAASAGEGLAAGAALRPLVELLTSQGNSPEMIRRFLTLMDPAKRSKLGIQKVILSVGSGTGALEAQLAKVGGVAVIALDELSPHSKYYAPYYHDFLDDNLDVQVAAQTHNALVPLRADYFKILEYLPEGAVDDLLFINPEEKVLLGLFEGLKGGVDRLKDINRILSGRGGVYLKPYVNFSRLPAEDQAYFRKNFSIFGKSLWGVTVNTYSDFPAITKVFVYNPSRTPVYGDEEEETMEAFQRSVTRQDEEILNSPVFGFNDEDRAFLERILSMGMAGREGFVYFNLDYDQMRTTRADGQAVGNGREVLSISYATNQGHGYMIGRVEMAPLKGGHYQRVNGRWNVKVKGIDIEPIFVDKTLEIQENFGRLMSQLAVVSDEESAGHAAAAGKDAAMAAGRGKTQADKSNLGGIDFNPDRVQLELRNSGGAIVFQMDPLQLQQVKDAAGFEPVIVNIQPMPNLRAFLGMGDR